MIAIILFACAPPSDSRRPEPVEENPQCEPGEEITVESGFEDDEGLSFAWSIDRQFLADGGSFKPEDAPAVVLVCPTCPVEEDDYRYTVAVEVTDENGAVVWAYVTVEHVCAD